MFLNLLLKNYNAPICNMAMQTSSNNIDSELFKSWPLDQYWGSNFNMEIYRENVKKSSFQEVQCYNLWDYYLMQTFLNDVHSKLLKLWPPGPIIRPQ